MDVQKDFADLCSLLNANRVEYLVVGGYAVGFHGAPRFTGDLDLLVGPDLENVTRMLDAVRQFGFSSGDLAPEYLLVQRKIIQLGRVPVQVHIMTTISGVTWAEAWQSREPGAYAGVPVQFIGRATLIANKRSTGRTKDLADVEALEPSLPPPPDR
jgi:hypothetical protein